MLCGMVCCIACGVMVLYVVWCDDQYGVVSLVWFSMVCISIVWYGPVSTYGNIWFGMVCYVVWYRKMLRVQYMVI